MAGQPEHPGVVVAGVDGFTPVPPRTGRRVAVLRVLRETARPMTAGEVARRLRVHPNTVRFHLQALLREGSVQPVAPAAAASGRPAVRYRPVSGMDPGGPRGYRMLAAVFASGYDRRYAAETDPTARAVAVGRAWGRRLAPSTDEGARPSHREAAEMLVSLFAGLGFAPEPLPSQDPAPRVLVLRHCPFLELVTGDGAVPDGLVCAVHLGLMRGALDAVGASVAAERLEPFARPDRCVAHLTARRARHAPRSPVPVRSPARSPVSSPVTSPVTSPSPERDQVDREGVPDALGVPREPR
jgi:predicted ArsR family transcriptional regulator